MPNSRDILATKTTSNFGGPSSRIWPARNFTFFALSRNTAALHLWKTEHLAQFCFVFLPFFGILTGQLYIKEKEINNKTLIKLKDEKDRKTTSGKFSETKIFGAAHVHSVFYFSFNFVNVSFVKAIVRSQMIFLLTVGSWKFQTLDKHCLTTNWRWDIQQNDWGLQKDSEL